MIDRRAIAARVRGLAGVESALLALADELEAELTEAQALAVLHRLAAHLAAMPATERVRALAGDLSAMLEERGRGE